MTCGDWGIHPQFLRMNFFARGNQAQKPSPSTENKEIHQHTEWFRWRRTWFHNCMFVGDIQNKPRTHVSHFWLKGKNHSKNTYPLVITRLEKTSIYWCFSQLEHSIDRGFAAKVTMISGDIPVTFWHFHRNHLENFPLRNSSQFLWLVVWNMNFIFHHIWDNIWDVILPIDFHIFQDGYNHLALIRERCKLAARFRPFDRQWKWKGYNHQPVQYRD